MAAQTAKQLWASRGSCGRASLQELNMRKDLLTCVGTAEETGGLEEGPSLGHETSYTVTATD